MNRYKNMDRILNPKFFPQVTFISEGGLKSNDEEEKERLSDEKI